MSHLHDFSVVHLERSKDRRRNVAQMKSILPSLYIHKAIDGKKIKSSDKRRYQSQGVFPMDIKYDHVCQRPFTNQHLAIWLSHVTLWEHLASLPSHAQYHVIFEDDSILQPNFMSLLEKYTSKLVAKDFDFANMYVFPIQVDKYNIRRKGLYRVKRPLWGLQCYMVPHEKLQHLISIIKPLQTAIDEQITRIKMKHYFIYDDFLQHGLIKSENKYAPNPTKLSRKLCVQ